MGLERVTLAVLAILEPSQTGAFFIPIIHAGLLSLPWGERVEQAELLAHPTKTFMVTAVMVVTQGLLELPHYITLQGLLHRQLGQLAQEAIPLVHLARRETRLLRRRNKQLLFRAT